MSKVNFMAAATKSLASAGAGVAGVEIDILMAKTPLPKPIVQIGKIAASIAASFFMPKNEFVSNASAAMIGQSSAELYKSVTKRGGSISGVEDEIGDAGTIYVNEQGVQTDANGNLLMIEGIGYVDADGNQVNLDENGNLAGISNQDQY